jgi:hypothetical protein
MVHTGTAVALAPLVCLSVVDWSCTDCLADNLLTCKQLLS